MTATHKRLVQPNYRSSKPLTPAQEAARRHRRATLKETRCFHCRVEYSDWAVDWAEAWFEGKLDAADEFHLDWRDGETKIKCELCGLRAWIGPFSITLRSAEGTTAD